MYFGVVVIGRNEGERLRQCLRSLLPTVVAVYVDSGSTDGSAKWARDNGAEVVDLDTSVPFTAARARNAGFQRLLEKAPDVAFVQFVDGDCELADGWPQAALSFLNAHADVAAVCGSRRERYPDRSIYNWVCDQEWKAPIGEVHFCGGDVMMRVEALVAVGGFRDDMIAGEEPELCIRLRAAGWRVWRLDAEMTIHDIAMTHLGQWWRRAMRNGYGFAQGAHLHGSLPERYWVWESRRAWIWGVWLPLAAVATGITFGAWGWAVFLIYGVQMLRQMVRNPGTPRQRALMASFQLLARVPEGWGQMSFMRDRLLGRVPRLIEYK
jgi:GT2 family glycosyltransferase